MLDAFKLRASMTLFDRISGGNAVFRRVLDKYCSGVVDSLTDQIIGSTLS